MKKLVSIIPIVIAFSVFSVAFNNFFVFDDFIWLYRARTLEQNWNQMFHVEGMYFDPLIYLVFLADYIVAGLDPRWYHAVDVTIHAFNGFLVYRFANMLAEDAKTALYGSVLFASSFAVSDAVLWPSSRVDLVAVMFSLGTLIQFLKYLRTDKSRFLWISFLLFILALGAKGTPVVVPLFLLWLLLMEEKPLHRFVSVVPFGLLVILYFALLNLAAHHTNNPIGELHLNLRNLSLSLCEFFIPERQIASMNLAATAAVFALLVMVLSFLKFSTESSTRLRRTGVVILAGALLPVLILKDFKLAKNVEDSISLLSSPSHRIYLASVGFAFIGGGSLRSFELLIKRYSAKASNVMITLFIVGIIFINAIEIKERAHIWEEAGESTRLGLYRLLDHRERIVEDGVIGLVNFTGSSGFLNPMIKVYFNLHEVTTLKFFEKEDIADPEILKRAERSSFFVLGYDYRLYDLSDKFKRLLFLYRQANINPSMPQYMREYEAISIQLDQDIKNILP